MVDPPKKKKLCEYCNKPLVSFGYNRQNGKAHNDWKTRQYHKKCWKELYLYK